MSDVSQPTSDAMTIARLRSAIERVVHYQKLPLLTQIGCALGFAAAERDAWKAAYLWRIGFTERWRKEDVLVRERDRDTWEAEEKYGTDLISEVLKK